MKVEGSHTSENIKQSLLTTKAELGLLNILATTDNAANEIKVFDLLQWPRVPCFGHILNLAVKAGLAIPEISRLVANGRNIVSFFYRSPSATGFLQQKQEQQLA